MRVSVIIPVYNAAGTVSLCLDALINQECLPDEIIIVDNGSTDETVSKVKQIIKMVDRPEIHLAYESKKGPAAARNKGISAVCGELVAFIDSDCIPRADWLKNILKNFNEKPNLFALTGKTYGYSQHHLFEKYMALEWFWTEVKKKEHFFGQKRLSFQDWAMLRNGVYRREVFRRVGLLDEAFEPAGEDTDFCIRLIEEGFNVNFDPEVVVFHKDRDSLKSIFQQAFWYGAAHPKIIKKHFFKKIVLQLAFSRHLQFSNTPVTAWIRVSGFYFLLILAIGIVLFSKIYFAPLVILLYLYRKIYNALSKARIDASLIEMLAMIFLFLGRRFAYEFGKIYGSVKYKVVCF